MKIITNPFNNIKDFFSGKFKNIEKKIEKDSKELNQIETTLKNLQSDSKNLNENLQKCNAWSNKAMIKFWLFALLVWILGYLVYNTASFIFTIIAAYIVSMIVETFISWFTKIWLSRSLSIFFAYLIFILAILLLFIVIFPFIINQAIELVSVWLNYLAWIQRELSANGVYDMIMDMDKVPDWWKEYFFEYIGDQDFLTQVQIALQQNLSEIMSLGKEYIAKLWTTLISFISGFTTFLFDFIIFMTLSILFSVEKVSVMKFIANISGKEKYNLVYFKLQKIYKRLGLWLKARLFLSLYMAGALYLCLWILEIFGMWIPNKLSLALILWIFDVIPYIWPIVWSVPAIIAGITWFGVRGWIILICIAVVINMVENSVLIPLMMWKRLWMNMVVVFVSMIFGWMLMWLLWIFLAVPIAVVITLMLENDEPKEWSKSIDSLWDIKVDKKKKNISKSKTIKFKK